LSDEPAFPFPQPKVPDLKAAIRRARIEEAERSSVAADMRAGELARLEILRDALEPLYLQLPPAIDLFDLGLVPGEKPRLFVDIIAFVEMARDGKTYRLLQDLRSGRMLLAESAQVPALLEAVAAYLGRRLAERERALAGDVIVAPAAVAGADVDGKDRREREPVASLSADAPEAEGPRRFSRGDLAFMFVLGLILGAAALYGVALLRARGIELPFRLPFDLPAELRGAGG
jgi:hypothetical protein